MVVAVAAAAAVIADVVDDFNLARQGLGGW